MKKVCILAAAVLVMACAVEAHAANVGGIRTVSGEAQVERHGLFLSAEDGMTLLERDILLTGADGSMGVVFKDGSRLSLGPESRLRISDYAFDPGKENYSFFSRLVQGTASFITGQLGKLAPDSMAVETPSTTIGIRGTHFLVEVEPEQGE